MSRPKIVLAGLFAGACLLGSQLSAAAQYYPPYASDRMGSGGPRGVYADPYNGDDADFDPSPRARPATPRRGTSQSSLRRDPYMDQDTDLNGNPQPGIQPRAGARTAALPSDADPAYSSSLNYDDEVDHRLTTGRRVDDPTAQPRGTLTVDTRVRKLYLSQGDGSAIEYGIGVGRQGFAWKGTAMVGRKAFWPGWTPPRDMLLRRPDLPRHMDGGMDNPLGARALYLFQGGKDTMFRIHGTNEPDTIGKAVSSGCIRMLNADVMDLYQRVGKGARVVVI